MGSHPGVTGNGRPAAGSEDGDEGDNCRIQWARVAGCTSVSRLKPAARSAPSRFARSPLPVERKLSGDGGNAGKTTGSSSKLGPGLVVFPGRVRLRPLVFENAVVVGIRSCDGIGGDSRCGSGTWARVADTPCGGMRPRIGLRGLHSSFCQLVAADVQEWLDEGRAGLDPAGGERVLPGILLYETGGGIVDLGRTEESPPSIFLIPSAVTGITMLFPWFGDVKSSSSAMVVVVFCESLGKDLGQALRAPIGPLLAVEAFR